MPALSQFVDEGELPHGDLLIARHGKVCYRERFGYFDVEAKTPLPDDALFRVYSMTKPLTGVCLMSLYEEGRFQLTEPLSKYIPAFADMKVYAGGLRKNAAGEFEWDEVEAESEITIQQILNHTGGLSYGFDAPGMVNGVDRLYHEHPEGPGTQGNRPTGPDLSLEEYVDRLAAMPLVCQPGSEWNYSLGVDVQGRLIEVLTGQSFGEAMAERLFRPLGMDDTFFSVRECRSSPVPPFSC